MSGFIFFNSNFMKIFVTREIPDAGIKMLKEKGYEVEVSSKDGVLTKEELISAVKGKNYDAVLCLLTDKIDGDVFAAVPQVKIFANYAVGYDNIDLLAAQAHNKMITNTPGVLIESVAEHTFALMMTAAKRIVEADKFTREGKYKGWAPMLFLGSGLEGKTLGIIGLGRIGSKVAYYAAKGFGMRVVYYDMVKNEDFEKNTKATFLESVNEVLKESDFVSIHVPLNESTRHLINEEKLKMMKPSAILINTSRGAVIDEKALVKILKDKVIRGAALDVFENEPEIAKGLADLDNVVLTPHIASATEETRSKMSEIAADNIIAALKGEIPPNLVTLEIKNA